jgi:hypothetical protein
MPEAFSMNSGEEGARAVDLAGRDGLGVGGVEAFDIGVEGFDQLGVRNAERRGVQPRGDDDGFRQGGGPGDAGAPSL